ncbi:phytoene/squalene synthase family protein [Pelagibius sp.]|uniref:phytoene/squalene synthase family protein n=1 Tax=Pelagibius sp. TaxID=1931238 RepID=UPI00260E799F|nr:phytoene/squalene synthase family protein [Pelagibius sp.]
MTQLPSHVAALRQHDRDRYQTCLFAPAATRAHLFALYAFNYEIAKTAEVVSEAMLGQIRLQWWREALDGIYAGTPRQHDVVEALARAVAARHLPRDALEALIDAREFDLEGDAPESLEALRAYASATSGGLLRLALRVVDAQSPESQDAATNLGIAWALLGLLRAIPFHARQKRIYLPVDRCRATGLQLADLFELRPSGALAEVARGLAETAGEHLRQARHPRAAIPRRALPVFLLATLADRHLKRLEAAAYDPFDVALQGEAPGQVWRLAWAALHGRY